MPCFRVPVVLTITARDATHAYHAVAHSSITSLEIPGLLCIAVREAEPWPAYRRLRKRTTVRATTDAGMLHCPESPPTEREEEQEESRV